MIVNHQRYFLKRRSKTWKSRCPITCRKYSNPISVQLGRRLDHRTRLKTRMRFLTPYYKVD